MPNEKNGGTGKKRNKGKKGKNSREKKEVAKNDRNPLLGYLTKEESDAACSHHDFLNLPNGYVLYTHFGARHSRFYSLLEFAGDRYWDILLDTLLERAPSLQQFRREFNMVFEKCRCNYLFFWFVRHYEIDMWYRPEPGEKNPLKKKKKKKDLNVYSKFVANDWEAIFRLWIHLGGVYIEDIYRFAYAALVPIMEIVAKNASRIRLEKAAKAKEKKAQAKARLHATSAAKGKKRAFDELVSSKPHHEGTEDDEPHGDGERRGAEEHVLEENEGDQDKGDDGEEREEGEIEDDEGDGEEGEIEDDEGDGEEGEVNDDEEDEEDEETEDEDEENLRARKRARTDRSEAEEQFASEIANCIDAGPPILVKSHTSAGPSGSRSDPSMDAELAAALNELEERGPEQAEPTPQDLRDILRRRKDAGA